MVSVCVAMAVTGLPFCSQPDGERAREHFKSENYTVSWGTPRNFDLKAELEIGSGNGHGGTLGWLRFHPRQDGVDVLSVKFDAGWQPYKSKWPPDRAPVAVKHARMNLEAYVALLRDLAVVDAAKLKPIERLSFSSSSNNFWVFARLTQDKQTLIDLDWAGYDGSSSEIQYAKPRAAVAVARRAAKGLDFTTHLLTEEEQGWASAKFARDWKKFKHRDFHWWVRERYIETIGVIGDKAALPTLRDILATEPPKDGRRDASDGRCVYLAINAVTRLTNSDVRDKPVEEMDIEKTRREVLNLLQDVK